MSDHDGHSPTSGETVVAGAVVARIAERAANEVPGVLHAKVTSAPDERLLTTPQLGDDDGGQEVNGDGGHRTGEEGPDDAGDRVHVEASPVRLRVDAGVVYPQSVRTTGEALRRRVRERLGELSGVPDTRIDLRITELAPPPRPRPRRRVR